MANKQLLGLLALLVISPACNGDDDGPLPCARDFDCPAGQVCGDDGLCRDAVPGDERDFGEVNLEFSDATETYLVAVYALPGETAEAASFDLVSFSLDQGGAPAGALRWQAPEREPPYDADYWADRIAFEAQRRAGVASMAADLRAERISTFRPVARDACGGCGELQFCFPGQTTCEAQGYVTFTNGTTIQLDVAGTVGTTTRVKVLVDSNSGSGQMARDAATAFADAADIVLAAFGESAHSPDFDRNQDLSVAVVFSEAVGAIGGGNVVGFFEFRDFMAAGTSTSDGITATGNEADLLWSRVPSQMRSGCPPTDGCKQTVITHELAVGTLAHEYAHLLTYTRRVHTAGTGAENEVLWLDEGVAHLMEDVTGWGASNVGVVSAAMSAWPDTLLMGPPGDPLSSDTPAQRGQSYLFLRHIVDQTADDSVENASQVNVTLPGTLLGDTELGWQHPTFQSRGADGFWQWLLGTFATGRTEVTETAAMAYNYLQVGVAATGQPIGISTNRSFLDARNVEITLASDDIISDELTETSFPFESEVGISGSLLLKVTSSETGTTTLVGRGAAEVDLHLRAIRVW